MSEEPLHARRARLYVPEREQKLLAKLKSGRASARAMRLKLAAAQADAAQWERIAEAVDVNVRLSRFVLNGGETVYRYSKRIPGPPNSGTYDRWEMDAVYYKTRKAALIAWDDEQQTKDGT